MSQSSQLLSRLRLERAWLLGNLVYAVFRVLLARQVLADHGLNLWLFAIIEVISSVPWALGSARLTASVVQHRLDRALLWGTIALVGFLAPDVYVVIATHHVPVVVYVVLAIWISVAGTVSWVRLVREIRLRRGADEATRTAAPSSPSPH